jgi:hypothetical protein
MAVITMSIAQWAEVPDNPRQRDTERRAEFGRRNHLAEYHKTHDYVYAAVLKGDVFCKLDGHTRSYLWSRGDLDPPPSGQVQVLLIDVINKQEAMDIYDELDSIKAFKRVSDRVFGATREHGFRLRSSLLNGCKFGTQIKLAETGTYSGDAWSLIKRWKATLLDLDALNLPKKYPTLISAMLLSIRRDGLDRAGKFWKKVYANAGTKTEAGPDAVQALVHHMDIRKAEGRTAGYENVSDILARAWYAYEAWLDGKRVKRLGCAKIGAVIESIQKERSAKRGSKRSSAN